MGQPSIETVKVYTDFKEGWQDSQYPVMQIL